MQVDAVVNSYTTINEKNITDDFQTLVDATNVAAATNYYPSAAGMSMEGFRNFCLQAMISGGVTVTVEASIDNAASPDFVDITKSGTDRITNVAGGASFVDTNCLLDFVNLHVDKIRIKSVTSDASNAVQYNITRMR